MKKSLKRLGDLAGFGLHWARRPNRPLPEELTRQIEQNGVIHCTGEAQFKEIMKSGCLEPGRAVLGYCWSDPFIWFRAADPDKRKMGAIIKKISRQLGLRKSSVKVIHITFLDSSYLCNFRYRKCDMALRYNGQLREQEGKVVFEEFTEYTESI
jgi:hypothetical protein